MDLSIRTAGETAPGERDQKVESVLVVDDYASICNLVACQLRALGYRVLTAYDGMEAQHLLLERGVDSTDLLVTDLNMPRMGGVELAEWFQQQNPRAKVLLMATSLNGMKVGGRVGFLQKPFRIEAIEAQIRNLLEGASPGPRPTRRDL